MNGNPYFVQPAGDASQGLAGLSVVLSQVGEQKRRREEEERARQEAEQAQVEIAEAWRSQDPSQISAVAIKYPQVSESLFKAMNITRDDQKARMGTYLREVATAPDEQVEAIMEKRIQDVDARGGDSTQTREDLEAWRSDPKSARKRLEMAYAGVAPAEEFKAFQESRKQPDAPSGYRWKGNVLEAIPGGPAEKEDLTLVEVFDESSPTGTRMVPRSQAVGKPGKPGSSLKAKFNPETGEFEIEQGRGGMSTKTQGAVEDKILKAGDTLAQITSIKARAKPEFQQLGTRVGMAWSAAKDKINPASVSETDKQALNDFTQYKADAGQLFALTLKDLSGVAVNPTEFKRAEQWLPNPGSGLFDGDSPTQLQAKIERFEDFTRKALMKHAYIQRHGMNINDVDLEEMPVLMNQRGDQLAAEYKTQGVPDAKIPQMVRMRLADEFGLVAY